MHEEKLSGKFSFWQIWLKECIHAMYVHMASYVLARSATLNCWLSTITCGAWQFSLHNDGPCGFSTFLSVSVAARGVHNTLDARGGETEYCY